MRKGISAVIATILMLMIAIALAGVAFMYISGVFTTATQGIEVADIYCSEGAPDQIKMTIRNIGTSTLTSLTCTQTNPSEACSLTPAVNIAPGSTQVLSDDCGGTGTGRSCAYRLTPPVGKSIIASAYCT